MKPPTADSVSTVAPGLLFWSAYDPSVKCDLCSSAYLGPQGWVAIDPISVDDGAWAEAAEGEKPVAVLLTSGNHERASDLWRRKWKIPVLSSVEAADEFGVVPEVFYGTEPAHGLTPLPLPGAAEGETALLSPEGYLFLGDAVVNLEGQGLSLLPGKYCLDAKQLRASLKKLLDYEFSIVSFAHGSPLRTQAKERLRGLLA